jgi:hypothetical protein
MSGRWVTGLLALGALVAVPAQAAPRPTHVVQPGESLRSVAKAHGCSLSEIFLANKEVVSHPHMLGVGVTLTIPVCTPADAVDPETLGVSAAKEPPRPQHCAWESGSTDKARLRERLEAAEVPLPDFFQAIVVETTASKSGKHIAQQRVLTLGPVDRAEGWHPGLAVSLLSTIGALDRASQLGFTGGAAVTFRDDAGPTVAPVTVALEVLVDEALRLGRSYAHNRLVQLGGSDRLHGEAGVLAQRGLGSSVLNKAFDAAAWAEQGQARSLRRAPALKLVQGDRVVDIPSTVGARVSGCDQEACTTMTDLARAMCLVTQHERLPAARRLVLGEGTPAPNLALLRTALQRRKRQPQGALERIFTRALPPSKGYTVLRRSGRQDGWSTLVLAVTSSRQRREYVVAMTGYGKSHPLRDVAQALASLLKAEDL